MVMLVSIASAALSTRPMDDFTSSVTAPFFEARLGENASLAVLVFDPDTGRRFVDYSSTQVLRPASLQKLLTAAAALDVLGPSHRFVTSLETYGEVDEKGILHGDLIIRGGGDPTLGPHFQPDPSDTTRVFREWAADLKAAGILAIQGNIIGDDRLFEGDPHAIGWDPVDFGEWYAAEVSALTFNDGCIDVRWRGAGSQGKSAAYKLSPPTTYMNFESGVKIGRVPGSPAAISNYRADDQGKTIARGLIDAGAEVVESTAVRNPAHYTAYVFQEVLAREGIEVSGQATTPWPGQEIDPPGTEPWVIVRHYSPTLAEILPAVLAGSQNMYAETILRAVAVEMRHPPSFDGAADALTKWAQQNGFARSGFLVTDGSGLSTYDRISAQSIGEVLDSMSGWGEKRAIFRQSLARAGESGSLRGRLAGLKGRFIGKTGTLTGTSNLAGYLETEAGNDYIAVFMIDGAAGTTHLHREVLDEMLERLEARLP